MANDRPILYRPPETMRVNWKLAAYGDLDALIAADLAARDHVNGSVGASVVLDASNGPDSGRAMAETDSKGNL